MNIQIKLWLIFSFLFVIIAGILYVLITDSYEQRVLDSQKDVAINQGLTVTERLRGTYPRFEERTRGYLTSFSDRLDARLLIVDHMHVNVEDPGHYYVIFDSLQQIENERLSVEQWTVLQNVAQAPVSHFIESGNYGYLQQTLLPISTSRGGYLLINKDVNVVYEDVRSFRNWVLALIGTTIIIFFFLCYWIAGWFSRPIRKMISQMRKISPQKRSFTYAYHRNDEIGELVQAITRMVRQLNLYEQRQRQFLSASSHELKTPLATMQLITENLPHTRNEAQTAEFMDDLGTQIDKMKAMVNDLLHINRMWDMELDKQDVHTQDIRAHLESQFQHLAEYKNVLLVFEVTEMAVQADRELLFRAMDNLVSNAIRYSPNEAAIRIRIHPSPHPKHVPPSYRFATHISVCDNGIGIADHDLAYVFEPFYRSTDATKWDAEGSGLGLTIVKQIVELHDGTIDIQSTPEEGTCMFISLP